MKSSENIKENILDIFSRESLITKEELENNLKKCSIYDIGISSMIFVNIAGRIEEYFKVIIPNDIINTSNNLEYIIDNIIAIIEKKDLNYQ